MNAKSRGSAKHPKKPIGKKQSPSKPKPAAKKQSGKTAVSKKRKSTKLIFRNKILAMLIAGFFISAALLISIFHIYLNRQKETAITIPSGTIAEEQPTPDIAKSAPETNPESAKPEPAVPVSGKTDSGAPVVLPAAYPEQIPEKPSAGKLVFVIDDAGNNLRDLEPFLRFPGSITIAVLPALPDSAEAARRVRASGKEVFLHQPMESVGGSNPGPGAIYTGMDESEIRAIVNKNLDELWPVVGMNNHEGSKVTMDGAIMEIILDICSRRKIIFLDSRTTADTSAPEAAGKLGMRIAERDVFLDNEQDRDSVKYYLDIGLRRAGQKGNAVMIGHVSTAALAPLLDELYPQWLKQGYDLSTVSGLIKGR